MPLAILQARMSSRRLPGKSLRPILGVPLIVRAVDRIRRATTLDEVVLATSVDPTDDPLAEVARKAGLLVRRGSLDDVLHRFVTVIDEFEPDSIVRLTGDNVLTDPTVIDLVVRAHARSGADYTSNTLQRTYPRGLDVEVVRASALRKVAADSPTLEEREHVTLGVYRRPERFRLHSVTQSPDRSHLRWTVDYVEDLDFAENVYSELHTRLPNFGQEDILALLDRRPDLVRTEADTGV